MSLLRQTHCNSMRTRFYSGVRALAVMQTLRQARQLSVALFDESRVSWKNMSTCSLAEILDIITASGRVGSRLRVVSFRLAKCLQYVQYLLDCSFGMTTVLDVLFIYLFIFLLSTALREEVFLRVKCGIWVLFCEYKQYFTCNILIQLTAVCRVQNPPDANLYVCMYLYFLCVCICTITYTVAFLSGACVSQWRCHYRRRRWIAMQQWRVKDTAGSSPVHQLHKHTEDKSFPCIF